MDEEQKNSQSANDGAPNSFHPYEDEKQWQGKRENKYSRADDGEIVRKIVFSLCYIWGILFFISLIMYKDDEAKMHANEGLVLFLLTVIGNLIFGILMFVPILNVIFSIVSCVYSALLLTLGIFGIVYVVTEKRQPLPLIGGVKLLK